MLTALVQIYASQIPTGCGEMPKATTKLNPPRAFYTARKQWQEGRRKHDYASPLRLDVASVAGHTGPIRAGPI